MRACEFYSSLMRISDWDFKIKIVDRAAIDDNDGKVKINAYYKKAQIFLPTPESMPLCDHHPYNMLQCLLHEMVHVALFMVNQKVARDTLDYALFESQVDRFADLILEGYPNWRLEDVPPPEDATCEEINEATAQEINEVTAQEFESITGFQAGPVGKLSMVSWNAIRCQSVKSNLFRIVEKTEVEAVTDKGFVPQKDTEKR